MVSEIMLQQTQVSRVEKFYPVFLKQFPDFKTLAEAKTADVLRAWQGMGYNRRTLALQRLARIVKKERSGKLPKDRTILEALPGIGKGTSGSLMAFAFDEPVIFIETNIRRTFIHHFFPRRRNVLDAEIEPLVAKALDITKPREWYWALMDYGAALGMRSRAKKNPNRRSGHYARQSKFAGSDRELRGKILKIALAEKKITMSILAKRLTEPTPRVKKVAESLVRDGLLAYRGRSIGVSSTRV